MYDIKKISELTIKANLHLFKESITLRIEKTLKQKNLTILEINEQDELKGICIYQDYHEFRFVHNLCYIGDNKYIFFKFIKFIFNGDNWQSIYCETSKLNHRINQIYYKLGLKIVKEHDDILTLIYER